MLKPIPHNLTNTTLLDALLEHPKRLTKPVWWGLGIGWVIAAVFLITYFWLINIHWAQIQQKNYQDCLANAVSASQQYYLEFCQKKAAGSCNQHQLSEPELQGFLSFYEDARKACEAQQAN